MLKNVRIRCKKALPWHCWSSFNPKTAAAIYFREGRVCTHSSAEWRGLLHRNELDRWSFSQISASSCLQTCHKKISFARKLSSRVPAKKNNYCHGLDHIAALITHFQATFEKLQIFINEGRSICCISGPIAEEDVVFAAFGRRFIKTGRIAATLFQHLTFKLA